MFPEHLLDVTHAALFYAISIKWKAACVRKYL
jgi:hypothetical protein